MLKRGLVFLITVVALNGLAGCSAEKPVDMTMQVESQVAAEKNTDESKEQKEVDDTTVEIVSQKETLMSSEDMKELYENFMAGNAKVTVTDAVDHAEKGWMSYKGIISDGNECSLDEIKEAFRMDLAERFEMTKEEAAGYDFQTESAYIDCGADGIPELLVKEHTMFGPDEYTAFLIIKADWNGLRLCYSDAVNIRSFMSVNEYGYICEDGSGGASYHHFEKSFVDADGNRHFLYGNDNQSDLVTMSVYANGDFHDVPKKDTGDFDKVEFIGFYFEDKKDGERTYTYSYSITGEYNEDEPYDFCTLSRDPAVFDPESVYMKAFNEMGIDVVPLTDIDRMVREKEQAEGLDDAIKQGKTALQSIRG